MASYFFIGIGGTGMSSLAQIVRRKGHQVRGSDRNYDRGVNLRLFKCLKQSGIEFFPQDGSGVAGGIDCVVASAAVEDTVPDMARARALGIPVARRAELLAQLFNDSRGVAVGGTSGKSTTTAMIGWILHAAGKTPSIVNGAVMRNFEDISPPGNALGGKSDLFVIESDESDGSIALYRPAVALITNISKDHKTLPELKRLFEDFGRRARERVVVNADCPEASSLDFSERKTITFSTAKTADLMAENIRIEGLESEFRAGGARFRLKIPGIYNIYNALAAAAAAKALGVGEPESAAALAAFEGVRQRFEIIGETAGITVVEDFAHNPDKITAALRMLAPLGRRLLLVFQPHGFGPTAFLKDELIESFSANMKDRDILYMPEIYYAGGTAAKTISSSHITEGVCAGGKNAIFFNDRAPIAAALANEAGGNDLIVVMGARDPSLTEFCRHVLSELKKKNKPPAKTAGEKNTEAI